MITTRDLFYLAADYHRALPDRIRRYLNGRGIPDFEIDFRVLGWNGSRITIPIWNRKGVCAFFKFAKDPDDESPVPKMLTSRDSSAELYGWEVLRLPPQQVIICEGEFDRLVLEAQGFHAVTSTGGAGTFRAAWAEAFREIPEVYVCFDRDEAGRKGALRAARMIPHARIVELPEGVGEGGDVTDFFTRLRKTRDDFLALLGEAKPAPPEKEEPRPEPTPSSSAQSSELREKVDRLKREVLIDDVIDYYVQLRRNGQTLLGLCPFHEDRNPSFVVYPTKGTFHCYGCGAHGDALTFLQKVEQLSFKQALYVLQQFRGGNEAGS